MTIDPALDVAYDARATVADFDIYPRRYLESAERAYSRVGHVRDIAYGESQDEKLDVFPGEPGGPVLLFVHGGYWRALSKDHVAGIAFSLVPAGATVVLPGYSLAPRATLRDIVRQVDRAVDWTYAHIADYGADRSRLFVGGHSAGAHLAAAVATRLSSDGAGPPLAGVLALSGLFDLVPLVHTRSNEWLFLDVEDARSLSPQHALSSDVAGIPLIAAYGSLEPAGFLDQSWAFATAWAERGGISRTFEVPRCNHFDIVSMLEDPSTSVHEAAVRLLGLK